MKHQLGRKKLNRKAPHRRSMLRNQVIHFIRYGVLQSTKVRVKQVQKLAEKVVTVARKGYDFNTIRRVKSILPYDSKMVEKLIKEIAPKYVDRNGGYTRITRTRIRRGDATTMAFIELV